MDSLRRRSRTVVAAVAIACSSAVLAAGCGDEPAADRVGVLERQLTDAGVADAVPAKTRCRQQSSELRYTCTLQEGATGRKFTLQVVVTEKGSWTTNVERANVGAEFTSGVGVSGCCLPVE